MSARVRVTGGRMAMLVMVPIAAVALPLSMGIGPAMGAVEATVPAGASNGSSAWTVYHQDPAGSGVAPTVTSVDTSSPAWTSPTLDGQLYGEPLVSGARVYVATENDTVYALSAATGSVVWSTHVASPVPSTALPCGDVQPSVGITGTPVIDPARGELFAVADELVNGAPAHVLVGLDTATGKLEMTRNVDPAGADPAALLQRTGLALDAGQVVFGFGGNYGDCGSYRGWVVAVDEAGGTPADFAVDAGADQKQGAVWMGGGAPAVDGSGNVWVSAGNGSVTSSDLPYDNSDSVLELSSGLKLEQFFAPTTWASDNRDDLDFSMEPILLADGQVMIAGKSKIAFLLDGAHLGGIGGQQARLGSVCTDDIDGGSATVGTTVYLPCLSGIVAVSAGSTPPSLRLAWSSGSGGGPPIVAAGLVWSISQSGTLYGLDPTTGAARQQASIGVPANHFPTPSVGDGLLLAPSSDQVVAFAAPASTPGSTVPTTRPKSVGTPPSGRAAAAVTTGLSGAALAGIIVVALVVLVAVGLVLWRRRAHPGADSG
jgi:outer membrane protein assembly factor BamB